MLDPRNCTMWARYRPAASLIVVVAVLMTVTQLALADFAAQSDGGSSGPITEATSGVRGGSAQAGSSSGPDASAHHTAAISDGAAGVNNKDRNNRRAGHAADDASVDCLWTVNTHTHTTLFSSLAPGLRSRLDARAAVVYGLGKNLSTGFIGYPTDLFTSLPLARGSSPGPAAAAGSSAPLLSLSSDGSCTNRSDTDTVEDYFGKAAAATATDCCAACTADARCTFATWRGPGHDGGTGECWKKNASTLTPTPSPGTTLLTVNGRPAPPPPPSLPWSVAWKRNLLELPKAMAATAAGVLGSSRSGLLMIDYEPPFRPTWSLSTLSGAEQPRWAALLAQVHKDRLDAEWITLVGWQPPKPPPPGARWSTLSAAQQTDLQRVSWDYFVRTYLVAGVRAVRDAVPSSVVVGVWNWPFKFWRLPPGGLPQWNALMDEMGWLWAELDALIPDVYNEFYSGDASSRPSVLAACEVHNASYTEAYYQDNVDSAVRLRNKFSPDAKVILSAWWHYMCAQHVTDDDGCFVNDGNLPALFGARGYDAVALWGSVGSSPGEDANATHVVRYLDSVWLPFVQSHCREVSSSA